MKLGVRTKSVKEELEEMGVNKSDPKALIQSGRYIVARSRAAEYEECLRYIDLRSRGEFWKELGHASLDAFLSALRSAGQLG